MKCTIPEIAWHNRDPVLSIDIQPVKNECYRLVSGGTDCHILIWHLKITDSDTVDLEVVADLTRHQRAVNVVRWSPTGTYLGSGDDDGNIIIWKLKTDNVPLLEENSDKEQWIVHKVLRGHKDDVYDLCWSPNELKLVSGSIDNTAIIWDLKKGKLDNILTDHKGFVQGVTWDPKGDYIATLSSDRTCRLFKNLGKQVIKRIKKGKLPVPSDNQLYEKEVKYFHDDTFKSYFRRLTFTPDGNFLITPSGCVETDESKKALHGAYIFALHEGKQPVAILPSLKQNTIAIRCCPIQFELRDEGPPALIPLPYRMIIAVATDSDVILYDTQQHAPFAHMQKIHYTRLTDITWSPDGLILACSSTDGYCTFVTFSPNELGVQYKIEEIEEETVLDVLNNVADESEDVIVKETTANSSEKQPEAVTKPKTLTLLQQWAIKSPNNSILNKKSINEKVKNLIISETIEITDSPEKPPNNETSINKQITPKRIFPIKIGECSREATESSNNKLKLTPKRSSKKEPKEPSNGTTPKRNSILTFLKSENVTPTKKKKIIDKTVHVMPMECETEEARDAWKCVENKDCITLDEDSEFKLELTMSETCNSDVSNSLKTDSEIKLDDDTKYSKTNAPKDSKSKNSNEKSANMVGQVSTSSDSNLSQNNEQNSNDNITEVTGIKPKRRVPLITLSNVKENDNAEEKTINGGTNSNNSIQIESDRKQENKCTSNIKENETAAIDKKLAAKEINTKSSEEKLKGRRVALITLSGPKTKCKKEI